MLAVIDVLVRHAVPYVWEYVYDSYDDTVPDRLRLPVELVTMPGIAGDAARRGAGRVLRTYLPLTTSDVVHRQMRLEEVRASLSDDDGERAAQAQVHLDAAIAMNAYLRETLVPLLDPGRELELGEVLDAVRQLVEVARRNDFEGTDTADRARADGIAMLRLLSTGRREELHLATLRVSRLRGHGARIAP